SNNKEMVEQQNYIFENLWNNGIDAEKQIKMIEQGTPPVETRIIENPDKIADKIKTEILNSNEIIACYQRGRLELIYDNFFDLYKEVLDRQRKGKHKGIKLIVTLDKDILELVKQFVKAGVQVRHVRNLLPLSFVVTDREVQANLEDIKGRKIIHSLLTSNEPVYVKQFASVFEQLWNEGIDAKLKIKDLEEGSENEIEVIQNPARALELYFYTLDTAKDDILLIFPTVSAIVRQEKLGILNRVRTAAEDRHVSVRIMTPSDSSPIAALADLIKDGNKEIGIRFIETISGRATVLIVDKRISLVMELKDDSKDNFLDAIGLSTYSNSKAGVLSYVAMFESLWSQTELMSQLKVQDRMQKEFINVAAHELRTPIQPILSLTEALRSEVTTSEGQEMLNIIIRNAERLRQLAEDILDVTRIESQTFRLNKENFSLDEILTRIMTDCREVNLRSTDLELTLESVSNETFVEADKPRIAQVITNLLTNAIRFTKSGNVSVAVTKGNANDIVVSIRDTGQGIDPEIMPRLFTRFATKSIRGTGLGLFISKSIIEAHGGSIWAENNLDGSGATFTFTLPAKVS
ncbi:MAG: HAMP domain-containing histidine kinase, partial [Thermoproteota archaeon]|nr:HAMP domain-containing histidine kinase [Thermoproteota archaeon]